MYSIAFINFILKYVCRLETLGFFDFFLFRKAVLIAHQTKANALHGHPHQLHKSIQAQVAFMCIYKDCSQLLKTHRGFGMGKKKTSECDLLQFSMPLACMHQQKQTCE